MAIIYKDNEQILIEIKKIMLETKTTQREIADKLGIKPQGLTKMLNKKNFGFEDAQKILVTMGYDLIIDFKQSMVSRIAPEADERIERDHQIPEFSQEDNTPADPTQRKADPDTASRNAFEKRREHLLKQYEAMASTAGKGAPSSHTDPCHVKASSDPVTSPGETFEEKMERLRREHGCSRMT